jgi:dCMP deaminase
MKDIKDIQGLNKWDKRFLYLAKHVSTWSKDPSTGIGAVITNNKNRIISIGFNGYPRNVPDEGMDDREEKYLKVIHAEENALLFAQRSLCGCTIYVYPLLPCGNCMAKIIQVGITKVVVLVHDTNGIIERWEKSNKIALNMAECANVNVSTYLLP